MDVVVYHNPDCGTSRNTLALLRHQGIEPHVIEYLKTPPSGALLMQLAARMKLPLRALLRERGTPFRELGLDGEGLDDAALLAAIAEHPILINRPLVATHSGVKLCRPSEVVLDLLPSIGSADLDKEDGTPFLRDKQVSARDPRLAKFLRDVGLPTADLRESAGAFFSYRTLGGPVGGRLVGYAGFELYDDGALLRSLAVKEDARGHGAGRNIAQLLMSRAYDRGARQAFLFTASAAGYFEKIGFKAIARSDAPAAIRASTQATVLCPSTAALLSRRISP